jgi:hypothetical protein
LVTDSSGLATGLGNSQGGIVSNTFNGSPNSGSIIGVVAVMLMMLIEGKPDQLQWSGMDIFMVHKQLYNLWKI